MSIHNINYRKIKCNWQRNVIGNQLRCTRDIHGRINGAPPGINILASRLGNISVYDKFQRQRDGGIPAKSGTQAGSLNENRPAWSARLSE